MTAGLSPLLDVSRPIILNVVKLLGPVLCFDRAIHTVVAKTTAIETSIVLTEIVTLLVREFWTGKKLVSNINLWWLVLVLVSVVEVCCFVFCWVDCIS